MGHHTPLPPRALVLRAAVDAAVMAPSTHNSQPWRFRIVGDTLEVLADPQRRLQVIDPARRQQIISCGAALYNARVAVRAMGFTDEVTVMLADGEHPELLATLHLGAPRAPSDLDRAQMTAISRRHTNRRAFLPRPLPAVITDELIDAAGREGVRMVRLDPAQKRALGQTVDEADRQQYADPAFRAELARWLIGGLSLRRDGIPFAEKEYGSALPFAAVRALRSPELGDDLGALEHVLVDSAPAVAVLGTATDDPADWLRCGEALQVVLLRATTYELSAAFLNQALEVPALRDRVAALVPEIGFPQMILRLGVTEDAVERVAPRRAVDDVLEVVA